MTEFDDVMRLLRDRRPEATELELDQIKQRVRRRAAQPSRRKQSMKSRLAILSMLVAGMLMSTTGAGLAVSGLSGSGDASEAVYGTPTPTPPSTPPETPPTTPPASPTPPPTGGVLGESDTSPAKGSSPSKPATSPGAVQGAEAAQPARQVEAGAGSGELPFTGFAAIPVILIGAALMAGGLVLRRRTGDNRS
jgi:hypothetical protein